MLVPTCCCFLAVLVIDSLLLLVESKRGYRSNKLKLLNPQSSYSSYEYGMYFLPTTDFILWAYIL